MKLLENFNNKISIKTKGIIYVVILIGFIYISISIIVLSVARRNILSQMKNFHNSIARKLVLTAADSLVSENYSYLMQQVRQLQATEQIKAVRVIDSRGIIVASDKIQEIGTTDRQLQDIMLSRKSQNESGLDIMMPVTIDGDILGAVRIGFDWDAEQELIRGEFYKIKMRLFYLALVIFVIGVGGAFVVSRKLTRPIIELLKEIEEFDKEIYQSGEDHSRSSYGDETVQLSHAFHQMLRNLRKYLKEFIRMSEEKEKLSCMATVGQMSAQIAHEIRNSLYAISGAISGLEAVSNRNDMIEYIEIVRDEVREMTMVTERFLRFARMPEPSPVRCNIEDIIKKVNDLLEPDLEESGIKVTVEGERPPDTIADPTLLKQAFMNIMMNSVQAIEKDGEINISMDTSSGYIVVTIEDSGPGIPSEIAEMIFRPFFTTKHDGTGLGLAIVYKIVLSHHGEVFFENTKNGACFTVRIPVRHAGNSQADIMVKKL